MSTQGVRRLGVDPLVRLAAAMSPPERALVLAVALLCVGPAAGHYSPRAEGYLWAAAVLVGALAWTQPSLSGLISWARSLTVPGVVAVVCYLLLLGWAGQSLLWSGTPSRALAALTIALSAVTVLLPLMALHRQGVGPLMTMRIAALVAVTASLPLAAHQQLALPGARLALPLGAGSTYPVPMLIALAVLAAAAAERGPARPLWALGALSAVALVVLSGSRSGIAMLVALGLAATLLLSARPGRRRLATSVAAAWLLFIAFAAWYLPRVHNAWYIPRLSSVLSDPGRRANALAALDAWTDTPRSVLLGQGEQSVWPWFATELASGGSGPFSRESPFGRLLYHPHSTYIGALAELGLVGLALWSGVVLAVLVACWSAVRGPAGGAIVAVAVMLSLAGMALDYHLRRDFPGALVWWTIALLGPLSGGSCPVRHKNVTDTSARR